MRYSHGELVQLAEEGRRKKMPRYIDAEKLTEALREKCDRCEDTRTDFCSTRWCDIAKVIKMIDNAPTVDVAERRKGEWNVIWGSEVVCSECKMNAPEAMRGCLANRHLEQIRTNFCPNCGADMRGEQDAEIH